MTLNPLNSKFRQAPEHLLGDELERGVRRLELVAVASSSLFASSAYKRVMLAEPGCMARVLEYRAHRPATTPELPRIAYALRFYVLEDSSPAHAVGVARRLVRETRIAHIRLAHVVRHVATSDTTPTLRELASAAGEAPRSRA